MTFRISESSAAYLMVAAAVVAVSAHLYLKKAPKQVRKITTADDLDFDLACDFVSQTDLPSKAKLKLYGLYKQATAGDCPSDVDRSGAVRRAMAEAWKHRTGMTLSQARGKYVRVLDKASPGWRNSAADGFSTGAFSLPVSQNSSNDPAIIRGDLEAVRLQISENKNLLTERDALSLTFLHVAADRGFSEICSFLIAEGAEISAVDENGETPLHLAAVSGQVEAVKILLAAGANKNLKNSEGQTAAEATDFKEIKIILK